MKKTVLIFALLLSTISSSFAGWESRESIWFDGFDEHGTAQVNNKALYANINTYVDWITLSYNIYYFQPGGYLDLGVVDNGNTIFYQNITSQSANTHYLLTATGPSSYWQSLVVYTESYNTNGSVTLNWGQI